MAHPAQDARDEVLRVHPEAVVVERKRNSIKHQIADGPRGQPRFVLDSGIGPMHFGPLEDQEINTAWQAGTAPWDFEMTQAGYNAHALADFSSGQIIQYVHPRTGENITFQPQQLQYTNDLDQIQAIANPQSVAAVVQDEDSLFWAGAYGPGLDLRWQAQTARLDKRLIVDSAARFPAPQQFILDGGNPVLRFQFIFQVSNGVDIYVNDELWTRGPNSRVDTQGYVEFRLRLTGEILWQFELPLTIKKNIPLGGNESPELLGTFRMRRQANNLFVEHRIPLIDLRSATYPVEIDTTIDEDIGASLDDVHGATIANGSWLDGRSTRFGFRFTGISGLGGATIDVATMDVYIFWILQGNDPNLLIHFERSDAGGAFSVGANMNARTRTSASTTWSATDVGLDEFVTTPSLVTPMQEMADNHDPSELISIWVAAGSNMGTDIGAYNGGPSHVNSLHIEYTAGGGAGIPNRVVQIKQGIKRAATY